MKNLTQQINYYNFLLNITVTYFVPWVKHNDFDIVFPQNQTTNPSFDLAPQYLR